MFCLPEKTGNKFLFLYYFREKKISQTKQQGLPWARFLCFKKIPLKQNKLLKSKHDMFDGKFVTEKENKISSEKNVGFLLVNTRQNITNKIVNMFRLNVIKKKKQSAMVLCRKVIFSRRYLLVKKKNQ